MSARRPPKTSEEITEASLRLFDDIKAVFHPLKRWPATAGFEERRHDLLRHVHKLFWTCGDETDIAKVIQDHHRLVACTNVFGQDRTAAVLSGPVLTNVKVEFEPQSAARTVAVGVLMHVTGRLHLKFAADDFWYMPVSYADAFGLVQAAGGVVLAAPGTLPIIESLAVLRGDLDSVA